MAALELLALRDAPEEALRLLTDYEAAAAPSQQAWLALALPPLREEIREGRATGAIWVGPKEDAIGIATWKEVPRLGRRISHVFLADGYRHPTTLARFLDLLQRREADAPLVAVPEEVPGISSEDVGLVLRSRGFARQRRTAMRRTVRTSDSAPAPLEGRRPGGRPPSPICDEDRQGLKALYVKAFGASLDRGWVDDGDLGRDFDGVWEGLLGEVWGPWLGEASLAYREERGLLGATLVTVPPRRCPLLLEIMVDPAVQGRGIGRALLAATLEAVDHAGHSELELNVLRENLAAFHLYSSLGFHVVEGTEAVFWVRANPRTEDPPQLA
ncbi:MAG: GNAT family N-acetyltransferase [Euryarchaeota archaeon]|nr:GNAT family N-acetyltransferase [Euryarchaeota archaeon]MDE1835116.1 GNAT family N-acetyltransferase [Euryarchaeota archaeon]MDE1880698.1 GNAT family N-acetyltransferase [Euryarchaeota archaeon]MDE2044921.1 GNAT family N-acetyltransferase [Thermoplasmata archaeon]